MYQLCCSESDLDGRLPLVGNWLLEGELQYWVRASDRSRGIS